MLCSIAGPFTSLSLSLSLCLSLFFSSLRLCIKLSAFRDHCYRPKTEREGERARACEQVRVMKCACVCEGESVYACVYERVYPFLRSVPLCQLLLLQFRLLLPSKTGEKE